MKHIELHMPVPGSPVDELLLSEVLYRCCADPAMESLLSKRL